MPWESRLARRSASGALSVTSTSASSIGPIRAKMPRPSLEESARITTWSEWSIIWRMRVASAILPVDSPCLLDMAPTPMKAMSHWNRRLSSAFWPSAVVRSPVVVWAHGRTGPPTTKISSATPGAITAGSWRLLVTMRSPSPGSRCSTRASAVVPPLMMMEASGRTSVAAMRPTRLFSSACRRLRTSTPVVVLGTMSTLTAPPWVRMTRPSASSSSRSRRIVSVETLNRPASVATDTSPTEDT